MSWGRTLVIDTSPPQGPVIYADENETELKMAFAKAVFELGDRWSQAGFRVFQGPDNHGRALQAGIWINDTAVQLEIDRLRRAEEAGENVPTKEQFVSHLWQRAKNEDDLKKAAAIYKLVGEALDFVGSGTNINVDASSNVTNVLRVPEKATDREAFAQRFREQQLKLVADARSGG